MTGTSRPHAILSRQYLPPASHTLRYMLPARTCGLAIGDASVSVKVNWSPYSGASTASAASAIAGAAALPAMKGNTSVSCLSCLHGS